MTTTAFAVAANDAVSQGPDARLAVIIEQLAEPRRDIERTFLDMGQSLLGCTALLNEISSAHEGMPGELESADFNTATELLGTIRHEVEEMAAANSTEQDHIGQLNTMAAGIAAPLGELRRATRTIRLIAVNARIAAAYVEGHQVDIGAFTDDMTTLGTGVHEAVAAFADAYGGFAASLADARAANAAFTARHGGTMAEISGRLAGHLSAIDEHRVRAGTKADEHGQLTARIRGRIGAAVAALQTGDIVRQRIEHVEQALETLADGEIDSVGGEAAAQTTAAVLHLQAAQLDETLAEFDEQILDLTRSLRTLTTDAATVLDAGNAEAEALLSDGGTALNAMIGDLDAIRVLFADFGQTRAGIEKTASEVVRAVAVMMEHLDAIAGIEHQIRLLSLNTTIHCSRLGEDGAALRVIAQDLRELAQQTVTAAGSIMAGMSEADTLARYLAEHNSSETGERIAALAKDAETAAGLFDTVVNRLHARAGTVAAAGPRAMHQLEAAADSVSGRRDFVENWRDARMEILALAPLASEAVDRTALDPDLISQLRARYTMDSERHVHDALLGAPIAAAKEDSTSPAETDLDDIFF